MAWGASVRTQLPSLDDVVGADLAVKLDPSYRSPDSVASSVSLSPLTSPLRSLEGSSTFTFDELPAAAHTEAPATPGKSDGILLKSPPRRASFGGRLGSPSGGQSSKPPRARPRVQSHPVARAEEPTHDESISPDIIAKFVRLISDFENAASVNARGRYNQFLFLTDRSSDIAQWVGSNPNKVFQMYYYGTVQNVTQSLDCPLFRKSGSPHIDWRAISLQALHESLLSSFPFRSPRADFAFTDQARVVLTRINKNRPSEYLTQVVAIMTKLNNSRLISHPAIARTIPRFVSLLIRVIEGQLIDPRFVEMLLTVLNVTIRLWSKISHESTASFYIDLLADVYTRYMSSLEYMALWVSDETDDSEVDRLLTSSETATGEIYARIFQIENVIDSLPRIESYFSTLFENIPGEILGARTSRSVPFLYSLFTKLSPDQLEDYLTLVPKLTSERVHERASIVEFLSLNFLIENEDSSGNWLKIADQLTKTKTNGQYRLDTDMRNHWLNRHDDEDGGACKTTTDFELVGLVVNGSILMRTKNLSRDLIEKWKVLIRQLASFVNNHKMTLQDTFTISTLIPARHVVRQMLNYEEAV